MSYIVNPRSCARFDLGKSYNLCQNLPTGVEG